LVCISGRKAASNRQQGNEAARQRGSKAKRHEGKRESGFGVGSAHARRENRRAIRHPCALKFRYSSG
jgi:hypothetical protein